MRDPKAYSYAVVRIVPRVDREEFLNAGVILFSPQLRFLGSRIQISGWQLRHLWPQLDLATVQRHLDTIPRICNGDADAGPIARLTQKERFHWLTAPRSTIVQISPVRTGLTDDPAAALDHLMQELVG